MGTSSAMGIEVSDAIVVELPNDRIENYIRATHEQMKSSLQLVVIIFPSFQNDRRWWSLYNVTVVNLFYIVLNLIGSKCMDSLPSLSESTIELST